MRNFFGNARFIIPLWPSLPILAITTLAAGIMTAASRDSTVRTESASCAVGEVITTRDGIGFRLACQEGSMVTNTDTFKPATVLEIMRNRPERITCTVKQSGWTENCRLGG